MEARTHDRPEGPSSFKEGLCHSSSVMREQEYNPVISCTIHGPQRTRSSGSGGACSKKLVECQTESRHKWKVDVRHDDDDAAKHSVIQVAHVYVSAHALVA